jgi:hypothetical protein
MILRGEGRALLGEVARDCVASMLVIIAILPTKGLNPSLVERPKVGRNAEIVVRCLKFGIYHLDDFGSVQ